MCVSRKDVTMWHVLVRKLAHLDISACKLCSRQETKHCEADCQVPRDCKLSVCHARTSYRLGGLVSLSDFQTASSPVSQGGPAGLDARRQALAALQRSSDLCMMAHRARQKKSVRLARAMWRRCRSFASGRWCRALYRSCARLAH